MVLQGCRSRGTGLEKNQSLLASPLYCLLQSTLVCHFCLLFMQPDLQMEKSKTGQYSQHLPHLSSSETWQWRFPKSPGESLAFESSCLRTPVPLPGSPARQTRWFSMASDWGQTPPQSSKGKVPFPFFSPLELTFLLWWLAFSQCDSSAWSPAWCWPLMASWDRVRPAGREGNHYIIPRPCKHFPSLMNGLQRAGWLDLVWPASARVWVRI